MKKSIFICTVAVLIIFISMQTTARTVVTDGLVSYWTFDEKDIAENTVEDVWGNNNGTIVGDPNVVNGKVGDALEFDGTDDYINLTNLGDFGSKIGMSTFEAWVKTDFKQEWTTLFKVLDQGCSMAWAIDVNRSAKAGFLLAQNIVHYYVRQQAAACMDIAVEIEFELSDGNWHHIAFVVEDAGNTKINIYMDGQPQDVVVGKGNKLDNFVPFVEPVYIGAANNRGNVERHFPGVIDEVRIYDRPLSEKEVVQNFESKVGLGVELTDKLPIVWGKLKTKL